MRAPRMTTPKKRILRRFTLDEISTVDAPAQAGAVMTLLKSREQQAADNAAACAYGARLFMENLSRAETAYRVIRERRQPQPQSQVSTAKGAEVVDVQSFERIVKAVQA